MPTRRELQAGVGEAVELLLRGLGPSNPYNLWKSKLVSAPAWTVRHPGSAVR